MVSTYRPRITRELRDTVLEVGETLNGQGPQSYQEALRLLVRYFDVLQRQVKCPECGETDIEETVSGKYRCWRCEQDRDSGNFTVWDVLDPDNREQASLPALPNDVHLRFECDHDHSEAGSNGEERSQHGDIQEPQRHNTQPNQWDNGF